MGPTAETIPILRDISLFVKTGESVAITGRSGAGKTTLLSLMAGLDLPTQGEVIFDSHNLSRLSEEDRAALRLGKVSFVFQEFQLMRHLSALQNVMLPLELLGQADAKAKAMYFLEKIGLAHRAHHAPTKLSGGEQQRVALARAFVISPKLLFADEPTANLDDETARTITQLLFNLCETQNTTLVLVTHDKILSQRCARRYALSKGMLESAS